MKEIIRFNREEIENEFMALLLNKNELLDLLQIKPKYLFVEKNKILLQQLLECWNKNKVINLEFIVEKHKDFDFNWWGNLLIDTFYYDQNSMEQLKLSEESIIKFYKEDIIQNLNDKLKREEITYDRFMDDMKKLDSIKVQKSEEQMLTVKDIDMSKYEEPIRVKSNLCKLDQAIKGFALGQLSVWSGSNASAKSTYLNQIAIESINQGFNTAIYSGELIAQRLLKWITMQCAGKRNMLYEEKKDYWYVPDDKKRKITNWLNNKLFIYNNNIGNNAKEILYSIEQCVLKNNLKVVILDNLMSINLSNYGENKYDVQSQFVQDLSALAKRLNIHIHFVCHPRKVTSFLRKIDISGSADLTNIADNVFILHRINNDFRIKTKEMFKWNDSHDIYKFTNVVEVCKNRDFGIEDYFAGMYFESESKRLLNTPEEYKYYKWETSWD